MDPISHAASGAIAFCALKNRPSHRLALPLAALAAASPDVDVFFSSGPLQFLLLHRGITHSLAALPFMGLLLACFGFPLWRKTVTGHWSFTKAWLFMCAMAGLHIWLDIVTTYGTMIFLPFSHERVRLNGLFIVDPVFTLPLVGGLIYAVKKSSRAAALAAFAWIFLWPGLGVCLAKLHTATVMERLASQNIEARQVTVLPDALSPLFWRVLYMKNQGKEADLPPVVFDQPLDFLGRERGPAQSHMGIPAELAYDIAHTSKMGEYFLDFTILPVLVPLPARYLPQTQPVSDRAQSIGTIPASGMPAEGFWMAHDLRFGSSLAFVQKIMEMRFSAGMPPFVLMLELARDAAGRSGFVPVYERLLFSDSKRDSGWKKPSRSEKMPFGFEFSGML